MITKYKKNFNLLYVGLMGCFLSSSVLAQAQQLPNPMAQGQGNQTQPNSAQFGFMQGNNSNNSVYAAAQTPQAPQASVNASQVPQNNVTDGSVPNPNAGNTGNSNADISGVGSTSQNQAPNFTQQAALYQQAQQQQAQQQGYTPPANTNQSPQGQNSQPLNNGQPVASNPVIPNTNNEYNNYPIAPPSAIPSSPAMTPEERAYNDAKNKFVGTSPDKIKELHEEIYEEQKAVAELPVNMPESYTGSVKVSLQPGATPPVVRPFMGLTSVILFTDAYGNPWPVENFHFVSGKDFDIRRLDDQNEKDGSAFYIDAKTMVSESNVVFKLKGESRPVVITLLAGQPIHDANIEVRVQGKSPSAPVDVTPAPVYSAQELPPGAQSALNPILDGAPPPGGKEVKIEGDDQTRGWLMPNGHLVLRTPVVLISVARPTVVSSADGTHVYDLTRAVPVLKGTSNGSYVNLYVSGY
jgi:intracellular multiplication protein IcmK